MPRLILLNGPPAVGKSTIAQRYLAEHPLTLNLDVDRLRRFVGGWRDDPVAATRVVTDLAIPAAAVHLSAGHDVVVPHYLGRVDQLARFTHLAHSAAAELHEFVLMDTKDAVVRRFADRTRAAADAVHVDAQELLQRAGGMPQLEAMYDRLLLVIAARPAAQLMTAREGKIDETYLDVVARCTGSGPGPQNDRSTTTGA